MGRRLIRSLLEFTCQEANAEERERGTKSRSFFTDPRSSGEGLFSLEQLDITTTRPLSFFFSLLEIRTSRVERARVVEFFLV